MWKYPLADGVHKVETDPIVPFKVLGEWKVTINTCHMRFYVKKAADIAKKLHSFLDGP